MERKGLVSEDDLWVLDEKEIERSLAYEIHVENEIADIMDALSHRPDGESMLSPEAYAILATMRLR